MSGALRRLTRLARLTLHVLLGSLLAFTLIRTPAPGKTTAADRRTPVLVQWWMRRLIRILNVHVEIQGASAAGRTLFVANHITWLDIPCIAAHLPTLFVAKDEVRRWPVFGWLARRAGTLFLRRGQAEVTAAVVEQMVWVLASGRCLLIFPEGTSTDGRQVRRFHARLYQAAIHTHAAVQAIAVRYPHAGGTHPAAPFVGDDNLLRHLWRLLGAHSIRAELNFCRPLPAVGDRRALARFTHRQIIDILGVSMDDASARQRPVIPAS